MYRHLFILFSFAMQFVAAVDYAYSDTATHQPEAFYLASSKQEQALNSILLAESGSGFFLESVFQRPDPIYPQDKRALHMLSHKLINVLRNKEHELVNKDCRGHYLKGELCGFDYSPILCGQDASQQGYLFKTVNTEKSTTEILSIWAEPPVDPSRYTRYLLILEDGVWKLDGVDCGTNGSKFISQ